MVDVKAIRRRYKALRGTFNERTRRLWCGAEALSAGRGGISALQRITGLSYLTIARGVREARSPSPLPADRVRMPGAGRKRAEALDADLKPALRRVFN